MGPAGTDKDFHALCDEQVEEDDIDLLVAVRHATQHQRKVRRVHHWRSSPG